MDKSKRGISIYLYPFFYFFPMFASRKKNIIHGYLKDYCSLIFNGNQLSVNTIPNTIQNSVAVMCDKHTGQLLFYSDGENSYTKNGNVMPNGGGLMGGCGVSIALIVPSR